MSFKTALMQGFTLAALVSATTGATAQSPDATAAPKPAMHLNVVVESGNHTVQGFQQQDFTLRDNNSVRPITGFRQMDPSTEPVNVIIVIDSVNLGFSHVAYVRSEVEKYLRDKEGHLARPATLAVLTDTGMQIQKGFTTDGNALGDSLDSSQFGLRNIRRDSGFWGADERVQLSLTAIRQLTSYAATIPGRKLVLWISPGWPLLSGPNIVLGKKQQQQIFADVVALSRQFQQANLALYNINPLGPAEGLMNMNYYQNFVKGISKPAQTDLADLSLQVLSVQSGGAVFIGTTDVAGSLGRSVADTDSWYELSFDPQPAEKPDEYHHLQITVDKPGTVRTRDGYYAQPSQPQTGLH